MSEWKEYKISNIGKVVTGKTPRTSISDNYGGTIPFLSPSDDMESKYVLTTARCLTEKGLSEVKNCLIPRNSICVSCIGSDMGKSVITDRPLVTNQQINSIIPSESFDPHFVYYLMQGKRREIRFIGRNETAVPILNKSAFSNLTIMAPETDEQRRIASILSSLDEKIAVNRRICENLEAQAQALFKNWFIDFAPFKDGKFVESELGLIPEGWRVGTLGDICSYSTRRISIDDLSPQTYYSTENMLPNKMGAVEASSLPNVGTTTGCEPFDVLVSNIRPYFKKILRVDSICGCSSDVMCFHPTGSKYRAYLYRILYDDSFFSFIMAGSKGTKMPRGDKQQIMKYPIVLPHESVLDHFSNCVEAMFSMTSSLKQESLRLSTLRDTLLPKLMSGQIKINEIEKSL